MRKLRLFFGLSGILLLLSLAGSALGASRFVNGVLERDRQDCYLYLDFPSVDRILEGRFAALLQDLAPEPVQLSELESLVDLSIMVLTDSDLKFKASLVVAELQNSLTEEQLAEAFQEGEPFEMEVPGGLDLRPLGYHDGGPVPFYGALLVQEDQRKFLLGATTVEYLEAMARKAHSKGPERAKADLYSHLKLSRAALNLPDRVSQDLEMDLLVFEDQESFEVQLSSNLRLLLEDYSGRTITGKPPSQRPQLIGRGPLFALLSLHNPWIPEDLTPGDLALVDQEREELERNLAALELLTGLSWEDCLAVLRAPMALSLQGSLAVPLFGALPSATLQLSGASERFVQTLSSWALATGSLRGTSARPIYAEQYSGWSGLAFNSPTAPGLDLILAHQAGKGLAVTTAPMGENPFKEGALEVAPEIQDFLSQSHGLAFSCDVSALQDRLRQIMPLVKLFGDSDSIQFMEQLCAALEPWKALTFQLDLDSAELTLYFAPAPLEEAPQAVLDHQQPAGTQPLAGPAAAIAHLMAQPLDSIEAPAESDEADGAPETAEAPAAPEAAEEPRTSPEEPEALEAPDAEAPQEPAVSDEAPTDTEPLEPLAPGQDDGPAQAETYSQRMVRLMEPIYENVGYDIDGEVMAWMDNAKFFMIEDLEEREENTLIFYCGLTTVGLSEQERLDLAIQWSRSHPAPNLEVSVNGQECTFWMSQSLSVETDPGDDGLLLFAAEYGRNLRDLMDLLDW